MTMTRQHVDTLEGWRQLAHAECCHLSSSGVVPEWSSDRSRTARDPSPVPDNTHRPSPTLGKVYLVSLRQSSSGHRIPCFPLLSSANLMTPIDMLPRSVFMCSSASVHLFLVEPIA
jgi:hypothetical protein